MVAQAGIVQTELSGFVWQTAAAAPSANAIPRTLVTPCRRDHVFAPSGLAEQTLGRSSQALRAEAG
jgi:hypothetical protein